MSEQRAEELAEVFSRFGPAFMRWVRSGVDHEGLTFARIRLMWAIRTEGPQIMSELKDWLGVTARSVTSLVDGLEDEGYVVRRGHPEDRRATIIELTQDGQTVIDEAHEAHQAHASTLFERLDDGDRRELLRIMQTLLDELGAAEP